MKRLFGALVVTGVLLGIAASHQILAAGGNSGSVCVCVPTVNEIRSNGVVFLFGSVQCVEPDEVSELLADGGAILPDPGSSSQAMPGMCGVCRDADGDEVQCPPFD